MTASPTLERLLLEPAAALPKEHFVVAGPLYPETIAWPANVERIDAPQPREHRAFYNSQRYTLNVTRARHGARRLFAQRAALRGGGLRHADHQRRLAGTGDAFSSPGTRSSWPRFGEQVVARSSQNLPERSGAPIGRRARQRVLARAHRRPSRRRAGGHSSAAPPSRPRARATSSQPHFMSKKIRVAIIGVGNCASSLVQGVQFYRDASRGRLRARPDARGSRRLPPARYRVLRRLRHQRAQGRPRSERGHPRRSRITPSASPTSRRWA